MQEEKVKAVKNEAFISVYKFTSSITSNVTKSI